MGFSAGRKKCLGYNLSQQLCDMLIFSSDERGDVFKFLPLPATDTESSRGAKETGVGGRARLSRS